MFATTGATNTLNLSLSINATVGPSLLRGLDTIPNQPMGSYGLGCVPIGFNPGGLGSLRPATACGAAGGTKTDGYIQGLEDALKQVRGPKSKPDEERIRALIQGARQNRDNPQGSIGQGCSGHQVAAFCSPQVPGPLQSSGTCPAKPQSPPQGNWQQGYTEGIEAALKQIRGKDSKPDEKRVQALLQGAKQAQGGNPGQQPGNYLQQPFISLAPLPSPAFGAGVPSLFSGCRAGFTNLF